MLIFYIGVTYHDRNPENRSDTDILGKLATNTIYSTND
jgi:hypothetical protein